MIAILWDASHIWGYLLLHAVRSNGHSLPCTQRVRHSPDRSIWQDAHSARRFCAAQGRRPRAARRAGRAPLREGRRQISRLLRRRGARAGRRTRPLPLEPRRHDRPASASCVRASGLLRGRGRRSCSAEPRRKRRAAARVVAGPLQRAGRALRRAGACAIPRARARSLRGGHALFLHARRHSRRMEDHVRRRAAPLTARRPPLRRHGNLQQGRMASELQPP